MALGRCHNRDVYDRKKVTGPLLCIRSGSNKKSEKHGTPSKLSSNLLLSMEYQVLITSFILQLQTQMKSHKSTVSRWSKSQEGLRSWWFYSSLFPEDLRSQENEGIQDVFVVSELLPFY